MIRLRPYRTKDAEVITGWIKDEKWKGIEMELESNDFCI